MDKKQSSPMRVQIVKAAQPVEKADTSTQVTQQEAYNAGDWITPPLDLKGLRVLVKNSSILPQCVRAYKNNIAGFGIGVRYKDDIEETPEMAAEFERAEEIIELLNLEQDTKEVFEDIIEAREIYGISYLEVIRNVAGEVQQIEFIKDTPSITKTKPLEPYIATVFYHKGKQVERKKRYCKYRQSIGGKTVYFKEFGDPRIMDNRYGKYLEEGETLDIQYHANEIIEFARDIYTHAELGYKEFRTSQKFVNKMKELGLHTETGFAITGVKAYLNEEKKENASLALLGELDALRIPEHAYVNPETDAAHCCGHHAQMAGIFGAALALTVPEIAEKLDGQVVFFATPAEEYGEIGFKNELRAQGKIKYGGGKCELLRIGAFDDIDLCITHHIAPGDDIIVGSGTGNGFVSKVIRCLGKAAHAAGTPEQGVNALSAASLGLQALGLNRETFRDEDCVRVHPIITKGGNLVNVVPDEVVVETLVRAKTIEAFTDAAKKTDRSFHAGATAMGAKVEITTLPGYLPTLAEEALPELKRAAELSAPETNVIEASGHTGGSTDVGDVQHLMPVYTFNTGGVKGGLHQVEFEVTDEEEAYIVTAKMFALGAYGLLKEKAARSRELVKNYKPVFENSAKYAEFMDQFDSKEVLE